MGGTCLAERIQNVFMTFSRGIQNVFKTFSERIQIFN